VIEFEPEVHDQKLLRRSVVWARRNKYPIPSLSDLASGRDLRELTEIARSWQDAGLGRLIEVSEEGHRSVHFSLNDAALASVDAQYRRSLKGRLQSVSRSDWIAFGSFLVSAISLVVAVLAYRNS
jgi:hypothetical protein